MPATVRALMTYSVYEGYFLNGATFEVASIEKAKELEEKGLVEIVNTWGDDSYPSMMMSEEAHRLESKMREEIHSQQQQHQTRPTKQDMQNVNEDPSNDDLGEAGTMEQQRKAGSDLGGNGQSSHPGKSMNIQIVDQPKMVKRNEPPEMGVRGEEPFSEGGEGKITTPKFTIKILDESPSKKVDSAQFEDVVQDIGDGWFLLPNGEKVQGKETAMDLYNYYVQSQEEGFNK